MSDTYPELNRDHRRKRTDAQRERDLQEQRLRRVREPLNGLPEYCPVFRHIKLNYEAGRFTDATATLDRIKNELPYVRDNVIIVSWKANRLKSNATPAELRQLANFYNRGNTANTILHGVGTKLTWEAVAVIRESSESHGSLAKRFKVHRSAIYKVRKGRSWKA